MQALTVRARIRRHAPWLPVPLSAILLVSIVAVERLAIGSTTSLWTYWKDAITVLLSVSALVHTQFPRCSTALTWMDENELPTEDHDGSCVFTLRLLVEGPTVIKITLAPVPRFIVATLPDWQPVALSAVRVDCTLTNVAPGTFDIKVRISSTSRVPLFVDGELGIDVLVDAAGVPVRAMQKTIPICHAVGGGHETC